MSYSPNQRTTIDQEVYKWVMQQKEKDKVVTVNSIRQKAFTLGQEYDPNFKASLNWYNNWKKRYDYNESPEAEALKHKKRHYTAAFKLHAVQRAAEMESASQAALELDVSRRCLQRWTEELDLITSVVEHSSNAVYRRPGQGRKVVDSNLDVSLLEWLKDSWKQGVNVTSAMIREKAREMSQSTDFKASLGWYMKWQKRHGVDLKEQTCNSTPAETMSPLKLRLLQEGEVYTYSPTPLQPPAKRRKTTKKKLSYDDEALLENDEEFDRQLLTWLVERWEAGDIVSDRMVKDKAMEITPNPDFKSTKTWLSAWKRKYNISLENQTYGNEGDEEAEEIIEESQVYDNEVLLEEQQQQQQIAEQLQSGAGEPSSENRLTPTKEEAATALASLSAEDREAAGIEIAEALQKLANAFGIGAQGGDEAKQAMAQLTAAYQTDNPAFLLEGAGQVAVEEVVSEEVITDEPMVVIETGEEVTTSTTTQTSNAPAVSFSSVASTSTTSDSTPVSVVASDSTPSVTVTTTTATPIPKDQLSVTEVTTPTQDLAVTTISPSTTTDVVVTTSPIESYVSEEIVIVGPETTDEQVEVLVQGDNNEVVIMPTQEDEEVIVQQSETVQVATTTEVMNPMPSVETEVVTTPSGNSDVVVTSSLTIPPTMDAITTENVSMETVAGPQELLDIVQESITGIVTTPTESEVQSDSSTVRILDEDFKRNVVKRANELGSVQQAAKEFSLPWRAVMNWMSDKSICTRPAGSLQE